MKKTLLTLGVLFLVAIQARATVNPVVSDLGDNGGANQLRAAVNACLNNGGGTITFSVSGTVQLTSPLPGITTGVTIDGGSLITIRGGPNRAFVVSGSGVLTLKNLTVRDCSPSSGDGGAIQNFGARLIIDNCRAISNAVTTGWSGGAILSTGPLTISNCEFASNTGDGAGAVYPRFGNAVTTITNCNFHDNSATSRTAGFGGAILLWDGPTATVTDTLFNNNTSKLDGGAIYVMANSKLTCNNSTFTANRTLIDPLQGSGAGGAIWNAGTTVLNSTTVSGSNATLGGGIYSSGSLQIRSGSTIDNNSVRGLSGTAGGGIYAAGTLLLENSTISNNHAATGAGLDVSGAVTVSGATLIGNTAVNGGGAFVSGGTFEMSNGCVVKDNSATYGGGIQNGGETASGSSAGGSVIVHNTTFNGNTAGQSGGAIYTAAGATLTDVIVSANSAQGGKGGGIFHEKGELRLTNVTCTGNTASQSGAIENLAVAILTNVTISANSASGTGGGITNAASMTITNSTFSDNSASNGGGIYHSSGATTTLRNTVVANSSSGGNCFRPAGAGPIASSDGNASSDNTCSTFFNQPHDQNGINPLLGPLTNNGGYTPTHLPQSNSRLIDNGVATGAPAADQRGVARPQGAFFDTGSVEVRAADLATPTPTPTPTPTATPVSQLQNISTRKQVGAGDNVLIGGFIVVGNEDKKVLLRGLGPSLPVNGVLADPVLELHRADTTLLAANDDWKQAPNASEIATVLPPPKDVESAILTTLAAKSASQGGAGYTGVLAGKGGTSGTGLLEIYDVGTAANSKLVNISTRGSVGSGDDLLIGGFIPGPSGRAPLKVLVRALGPSLTSKGVAGALQDPVLELHDSNGGTIVMNDNWKDAANMAEIQATLPPSDERESAIIATLAPSNSGYTAVVRGAGGTTGVALVEVYALE